MKKINRETRKVIFNDDSENNFIETLPIINGETINVDDMVSTKDINEVDLLYNLKNRLSEEKTFTNVGPTLIIVNPFKDIKNIYCHEKIEYYIQKQELESPELREKNTEPHLYDLVLLAIREILKPNPKNQSLIISGESGAGKTVATKNSMECITYYFSKFNKNLNNKLDINNKNDTPLEKKILDCNPILEGFGNAKTLRNDNSSRFGKYVKIKFNNNTNIIEGAEMYTYLLEKSRITELNSKERNFHIFYYLLKGADDSFLKELYLQRDIKYYDYLWHDKNGTQITDVPSINDNECYKEVIDCFKSTNFSEEEIKQIFKVIAAVLLIGNLKFKIENNLCVFENEDIYNNICDLLSIDKNELLDAISRKFLPSEQKYSGAYEESKIKTYFDGLAKELYNKCFLWIVQKLNKTLDTKLDENLKYIGLLDIFGFECFEKEQNSLEQLCINYTNEQLQQLYIKDIFESDKLDFKKEGLEDKLYLLDATYKDNKDVIRLIKLFFMKISDITMEDKKIYDLVKGFDNLIKNDKAFQKVKENKFAVDKFVTPFFSVQHTAKTVEYYSNNFIDKNKDETKINVLKAILNSKNKIFNYIFTVTLNEEEFQKEKNRLTDDKKWVNKDEKFLGLKFCKEMKQLKKELKLCNHHYIRCLKSNELKKALHFQPNFVFNQIQYLGILATIQVRKNGYPMRRTFEDFCEYNKLIINKSIKDIKTTEEYKNLTSEILNILINDMINSDNNIIQENKLEEQYLLGKTKLFMKQNFSHKLELQKVKLQQKKVDAKNIIQLAIIKLKKTQKWKKCWENITDIQNYFRMNKNRILYQNKKDKIKIIQSMYLTSKAKNKINNINQNIFNIQNSLRIIIAKKHLDKNKNLLSCLTINIKIYLTKMKKIHKKKMNNVAKYIINKAREKIIYNEYNKLWNKVNPFFLKFLATKKHNEKIKKAENIIKREKYMKGMKVFQFNLLMNKINQRKEKIKFIYNFSSTKVMSKYWMNLIKNILVIQKYIKIAKDKNNILDRINRKYFDEDSKIIINEDNEINETLFPSLKINKIISDNSNNNNKTHRTKINTNIFQNTCPTLSLNNNYTISPNPTLQPKNEIKKYISELKSKIKNEYLPKYHNHLHPKILIFSKILELDIINDSSDIENNSWSDEYMNIYKQSLKSNTPIQKIFVGNCHSMALNSEGKVYTWGWNNYGQCGAYSNSTKQNFIIPMFKSEKNKTRKLPLINYKTSDDILPIHNVSDILLNDNYSIILTEKGNAISFGKNSNGELGLSHKKQVKNAQLISKFKNKVKIIKTTGNLNLLLNKNNELFIWSISKKILIQKPTMVYLPKKINIISISTGKNFAILLTSKGICYGLGSNEQGELGMNNITIKYCITPEEITELKKYNERIIQVNCGYKHTVCLSEKGKAYTWGNNSFCQLGHDSINNYTPNEVIIEDEYNEIIQIIQVTAGFRSTFFLGFNRSIYYCGKINEKKNCVKIPKKFNLMEKNQEISNENEFSVVKIWCTFSLYKSIFYASIADIRNISTKFKSKQKIKEILNILSINWLNDKKNPPFIPLIAQFFNSDFMKVDA